MVNNFVQIFFVCFFSLSLIIAQEDQHFAHNSKPDTIAPDTTNDVSTGPEISFKISSQDVGSVIQGSVLEYKFSFYNTGNEPLLISDVRTSCHCAVASFPKAPVLPEETGDINLDLDTQMPGQFTKSIAVYSNAIHDYDSTINQSRVMLKIRWNVIQEQER